MEDTLEEIINKLSDYKDYYKLILEENVRIFIEFERIFLEKYKVRNNSNKKIFELNLDKAEEFGIVKKFIEDFKNAEVTNEEIKNQIMNGILCYACCEENGDLIVKYLVEGLGLNINEINKETNKTPLEIIEELAKINKGGGKRLLDNIIGYQENAKNPFEKYSEKYNQDLILYINNILEENTNISRSTDNVILEDGPEINMELGNSTCGCLIM